MENPLYDNYLYVKNLGKTHYPEVFQKMKLFTQNRDRDIEDQDNENQVIENQKTTQKKPAQIDEFWVLEHYPVFTQGQAGKPEHILDPGDIPVIQSDRGGQVTYHAPGQLILYTLINLQRQKISVQTLVRKLEQAVIDLLKEDGIDAQTQCQAPGVYVEGVKIASVGLRVKRGCSYHGLSLNVDMDLEPFQRINPCGYAGLKVTQISHFKKNVVFEDIASKLVQYLAKSLGYNKIVVEMKEVEKMEEMKEMKEMKENG